MSKLDELMALVDEFALRFHGAAKYGGTPEAQREALSASLREVVADAERYTFLRGDFSPMGLNIDGNHAWAYRRNASLKGPTLDAAIDAARKA
jgi:hypothetical protein